MKRVLVTLAAFLAGLGAGIYLQHRWPLGRILAPKPPPLGAEIPLTTALAVPASDRIVLLAAGQSNAGNHGATRASGGAGVYAFSKGRLYPAVDPLPGASDIGGSIWTRLGSRLIARGGARVVVIAPIAQGSTRATDWAEGGRCHALLVNTLTQLAAANLTPTAILWQQGETEAWEADASGHAYAAAMRSVSGTVERLAPGAPILVARSTFGKGKRTNDQIRVVQSEPERYGARPGPDIDALGAEYRSDGVHLNDVGLSEAAERWYRSLRAILPANDTSRAE